MQGKREGSDRSAGAEWEKVWREQTIPEAQKLQWQQEQIREEWKEKKAPVREFEGAAKKNCSRMEARGKDSMSGERHWNWQKRR